MTSNNYEIHIQKAAFEKLVAEARTETSQGAGETIRVKSKKLTGTWIEVFKKEMNEYEEMDFKLKGSIGRIFEEKRKATTSYFNASAVCNETTDCKVSYKLVIEKKQEQDTDEAPSNRLMIKITRTNDHQHQQPKKQQLRGEERNEVVLRCLSEANGSASDFVDKIISTQVMAGEALPDLLKEKSSALKDAIRKAMHEYMNQEMVSTCWITNVNFIADSLKVSMPGPKMSGYVQRFQVAPDFVLGLQCEKQLHAIHRVPEEHRVVHVDSTGGLVKITQSMNDQYSDIMNYVFMLKNSRDFELPGVVVQEVATSRHDTMRIGEMWHLLKYNYLQVHDTSLKIDICVLDMSWASMHAFLEIMNLETMEEYSVRLFKYSVNPTSKRSFIASCLSHTMHRFTKGLK
jgi:hypothetical protein